jgi:hypothetical protein
MATSKTQETQPMKLALEDLPKCPDAIPAPPYPASNQRTRETYGSMVLVTVGTGENLGTFHLHEGLLRHYSSYFHAALKPEWQASSPPKAITLDLDDPKGFQAFFNWLYTGALYSTLNSNGSVPLRPVQICQIYVFGDARGIPELCNAAVNTLLQVSIQDWTFESPCLNYIYANTLPGSKLRKLMVDDAVGTYDFANLLDGAQLDKYPKDFLAEVLVSGGKRGELGKMGKRYVEWVKESV